MQHHALVLKLFVLSLKTSINLKINTHMTCGDNAQCAKSKVERKYKTEAEPNTNL